MSIGQPFEYWDPDDGSEITIYPVKWEQGIAPYKPIGREAKSGPVIRIWVDKDPPRAAPLNYWDFSGYRLQARLSPLLPGLIASKAALTLIRRGKGVQTDYEVRLG